MSWYGDMSAEARKHKIPFSCHLFIVQWNNRFLHLPGGKDSARCTWVNNTNLLSDKKCCTSIIWRAKFGMRPWEFTKFEREMLFGFYRRGLPAFTSCFLCGVPVTNGLMTSTGPSLHKNMDCSHSDFFRGKVSNFPACRSLKLAFVPGQAPHTDSMDH